MIDEDKRIISDMMVIYCKGRHGSKGELCHQCKELEAYAIKRLDRCRYGNKKPTCKVCPIHCYAPDMRAKMKEMMRYSGMRMLLFHPIYSIKHFYNELKRTKYEYRDNR